MKKLNLRIILLIVFFITILLTNQSNADMSAPKTYTYKASVSNVNGAQNYEYDWETKTLKVIGTFEYGKEINIIYEEELNGEKYGTVGSDTDKYGVIGQVKLSDIISIEKDFNMNDEDVYVCNLSGVVLTDEGITMHNGPSNSFAKVGQVIPKNTTLNFSKQYGLGGDESPAWYYTEYQGNKGWVCVLDSVIGFEKGKTTYITPVDVDIMKNEQKIGTIPANTVIENYYDVDMWSSSIYVSHDGVSGFVSIGDLASASVGVSVIITTNKNIMLYQEADHNSKALINVPLNTSFTSDWNLGHHYVEWAYVTYEGQKGWIHVNEEYQDENGNWQTESNATVEYNYTEDENQEFEPENEETSNALESNKTDIQHNNTEEKRVGLNGMQIVIICIIVALIISVTSLVTILLVNKTKKNI